jgi:hypothetical protein
MAKLNSSVDRRLTPSGFDRHNSTEDPGLPPEFILASSPRDSGVGRLFPPLGPQIRPVPEHISIVRFVESEKGSQEIVAESDTFLQFKRTRLVIDSVRQVNKWPPRKNSILKFSN